MTRFVMEFERPLYDLEAKLEELRRLDVSERPELATELEELAADVESLRATLYADLGPWERVQVSRHPDRPHTQDYVAALFADVFELRGDRSGSDDPAMFAGLGSLEGRRVVVLGHRKGKTTKENIERRFGSAQPEGFRKARRAMLLAERFGLPVVSFVDTPGAHPGIEAEERGQAWAIAENLATLSALRVPVVIVGIGEGGSGGALAIGFGDRLIMLENSYYSVSSPEACASIVFKDSSKASQTAASLCLTAADLVGLGIADEVVPEPAEGAHRDPGLAFERVRDSVVSALDDLAGRLPDDLVATRQGRLSRVGVFVDEGV
ncbi:MAG: acetyl-CoA carboxylase carboxyltransferase subunit alpha [Coriobacteriia bacterium]